MRFLDNDGMVGVQDALPGTAVEGHAMPFEPLVIIGMVGIVPTIIVYAELGQDADGLVT